MKLMTAQVGWARAGQHLYWTSDGGTHWKDIAPPVSQEETLGGVFFLDTSSGWVVVSHPDSKAEEQFRVMATTDAGLTWSSSAIVLPWERYAEDFVGGGSVYFFDRLNGWVNLELYHSSSLAPGRLLSTQDGGKTWQAPATDPGEAGTLCFFSGSDGVLTGGAQDTELWITHDGSKSWQQQSLKAPPKASSATFPTYGKPFCASGSGGFLPVTYSGPDGSMSALVLFATNDAGKSWTSDRVLPNLDEMSPGQIVPSSIVGSTLMAATKSEGVVTLATTGPDNRVSRIALRGFKQAPDLSFADTAHGWARGRNGIFSTIDGGASWTEITPIEAKPIAPPNKGAKTAARKRYTVSSRREKAVLSPNAAIGALKETRLGFDTGQAPSTSQMAAWWNYSPYYDYQISLAGAANHRINSNLTPTWVSTVEGYAGVCGRYGWVPKHRV